MSRRAGGPRFQALGTSVGFKHRGCARLPSAILFTATSKMALSVNLADIWKLFKDSKKNEKERIANWLDAVAHEASLMAAIWTETYQRVSEGAFGDKEMGAIESKLGLDRNIAPNE